MDERLLRVGEFLRRTRLSPKALRVYLTGREVGPDEPHLEIAWPVG